MDEVAEGVGELGVVPENEGVLGEGQILAIIAEIISNNRRDHK